MANILAATIHGNQMHEFSIAHHTTIELALNGTPPPTSSFGGDRAGRTTNKTRQTALLQEAAKEMNSHVLNVNLR